MVDVQKGPMWLYTIPPNTIITVRDDKGNMQFQYTNSTFYIKWLDRPFYVRPSWTVTVQKV